MRKSIVKIVAICLISSSMILTAFAHSGRTDSNGGHNKTSDGTYHYHKGDDRTIEYSTPQNGNESTTQAPTTQLQPEQPRSENNETTLNIGDKLGDVLNTDIKTYINGERIPSYNINNKSVVLIADLRNYGFDVVYDDATRTSTVTRNASKQFTPIQNIANNTAQVGTVAFSYVYTDITAIINGKKVESFNVQGSLAVYFASLGDYGTFSWDNDTRSSELTLNEK